MVIEIVCYILMSGELFVVEGDGCVVFCEILVFARECVNYFPEFGWVCCHYGVFYVCFPIVTFVAVHEVGDLTPHHRLSAPPHIRRDVKKFIKSKSGERVISRHFDHVATTFTRSVPVRLLVLGLSEAPCLP